jgi:hypothetical protein
MIVLADEVLSFLIFFKKGGIIPQNYFLIKFKLSVFLKKKNNFIII